VPLGAISTKADGVDPQPSDDAGSPLYNLVVHGASLGTPERTNSGDAIKAPGSSGAEGPRITGLLLPDPPSTSECLPSTSCTGPPTL
jgi:hypothetical protein